MNILVVASTFPSSDTDPVPSFVRDQVIAMKREDPSLMFSVLAPHDARSHTKSLAKHDAYDEYRFHYAWPARVEKLAGRGIMPALQANPLNYLLVPALFIGEFVALYRLTRQLRPDVIYAHWFTPQVVVARVVSALTGVPFVFTTHASDVSVWHKIPVLGKHIVRFSTRPSRGFTAVSQRSMEKLAVFFSASEWDHIRTRSEIIPMGINIPPSTPLTSQPNKNILFMGRLAEKKGVQYLLPSVADLVANDPEVTLTIAGDGAWREQLERQTKELNINSNVRFTGYVTGKEKQRLMDTHDMYVVPSIITSMGDAEGLPVSLMEGLSNRKLCIATNESGADDILTDGRDGFLVPERDSQALTEALTRALTLSKTTRHKLIAQARETARQFEWPTIARRHITLLFKVHDQKNSSDQ